MIIPKNQDINAGVVQGILNELASGVPDALIVPSLDNKKNVNLKMIVRVTLKDMQFYIYSSIGLL